MRTMAAALVSIAAFSGCGPNPNFRLSTYSGEDYEVPSGLLEVKRDGDRLAVRSPKHRFELKLPYDEVWKFHVCRIGASETQDADQDARHEVLWGISRTGLGLTLYLKRPGFRIEPEAYLRDVLHPEFSSSPAPPLKLRDGRPIMVFRPDQGGYSKVHGVRQRTDGIVYHLVLWTFEANDRPSIIEQMEEVAANHFRTFEP